MDASDEVEPEALQDFAGEFANMICGKWLTDAFRHGAFNLTPPLGASRVTAESPAQADTQYLYLSVNESPVRLGLRLTGAEAPVTERS